MKKVMLVFGTRPEAIKMCPLVKTCGYRSKTPSGIHTQTKSCRTIKMNMEKLKGKVILDCFNICPLDNTYHI